MWDWGHRLVTHTGNTSFQISKGRRGGGHHAGPTKESDTQAICPAVPRDPGSPLGLLAVLIIPAQVQSRQLNHSTPTHKAATNTLSAQESTAGSPSNREFKLPTLPAGRGHGGLPSLSCGGKLRNTLYYLRTHTPPPTGSVTCQLAFVCREGTAIPTRQTVGRPDPAIPNRPGPTAARNSFIPKESGGFCNVRTMYRKSRRQSGQQTGPLPQGTYGNHSRRFYINRTLLLNPSLPTTNTFI